ncbi:hypothetical protein CPLU01_11462 [Colletotrichum plurivorum]|uniref:DUF7730 domain-containing protein n=1 Tax=Colletotrichum plurivorum TaxID=2175906 RepID=A0A8H6N7J8_9PEZI|nr:hypothetical protein CPLU01_11462 [Colletotrichum plurivorum]
MSDDLSDKPDPLGSSTEPWQTYPHPQSQSAFFSALPLEIRRDIYRHLWRAAGPTQHVYKAGQSVLAPLSHCRCVADPDAEDIREAELTRVVADIPAADQPASEEDAAAAAAAQRDDINEWRLRTSSPWCHHWACEEEPPVLRPVEDWAAEDDEHKSENSKQKKRKPLLVKEFSPFLAVLLTCRRMYQESVDSIYDDTTFSFIGADPLSRFISTTNPDSLARITAIHLVWAAPIASYMDPDVDEAITARLAWTKIWADAATKLPCLRELRIWMYPQYARYPMPHEEWFRPLHLFRRVPVFNASLRWFSHPATPDTGPIDFLDEAPFTYNRVPPLEENPLHAHWRRLIGLFLDEPDAMPPRRQRKRRYVGRS